MEPGGDWCAYWTGVICSLLLWFCSFCLSPALWAVFRASHASPASDGRTLWCMRCQPLLTSAPPSLRRTHRLCSVTRHLTSGPQQELWCHQCPAMKPGWWAGFRLVPRWSSTTPMGILACKRPEDTARLFIFVQCVCMFLCVYVWVCTLQVCVWMCTPLPHSQTVEHLDHNSSSHSVLHRPLLQVQLGVTRAARGSGQGHQWLRWRQLPLVWQHHRDSHPHRPHIQTVPSDRQHERQLLPQRDLGCPHQQQQHTYADTHHQGPEFHHLAGGHELCHQGGIKTETHATRTRNNFFFYMSQTQINHTGCTSVDTVPASHTDWLWCNRLFLHFYFLV